MYFILCIFPGIYQIHRHLVRRLYFGRNVVKSSDFSWQALSWPVEPHFGHSRFAFKWRFKLYSQRKSTELSPISTFQAKDSLDAIIPQRTCAGKFILIWTWLFEKKGHFISEHCLILLILPRLIFFNLQASYGRNTRTIYQLEPDVP